MRRLRRRAVVLPVMAVLVAGMAFGLYWFQPWKLFVDHRVDERLPDVAVAADETTPPPVAPVPSASASPSVSATRATNRLVARGSLITHEHDTSGTVNIVELADGSRVLTLRNLDTSDGPDVEVWLTDAPVRAGEKGWYVFDDGAHVSLGDLKGNQGNQVYRIPKSVDLSRYTSVSLWCARFDVSFGAAELTPA